jgi:hypothetical protein
MKSPVWSLGIGALLVLLIYWVDYLTGPELRFFVFYFLPIAFVSWYTHQQVAVCFTVMAAAAWLAVDYLEGAVYSHWFIRYWNAAIRLIAFLIIALAVAYIKRKLAREQQLNQQLSAALAEVKRLSGFLPICASCKKIRNDQGYWEQIETYIRNHSEAEFTHSLCPECVPKIYPDLGRAKQ